MPRFTILSITLKTRSLQTAEKMIIAGTTVIHMAKQVLGKLEELGCEQTALPWTFKPELQKLKHAVSTIHAVLLDAEQKQAHDAGVKSWLEELSGLMYDADDLVDDLYTEARVSAAKDDEDEERRKTTMKTSDTCSIELCFLVFSFAKRLLYGIKMGHAMKAIREKLDGVWEDNDIFSCLEVRLEAEQPPVAVPWTAANSMPMEFVIGRQDDTERIVGQLVNYDCETDISVVTIIGMGGLGKTTLAEVIFNHELVRAHFEMRVWVSVPENFDIREILEKMLQSVTRQSHAGLQLDDLEELLLEEMGGKRFLLVLDDVWYEGVESWKRLGQCLTIGGAAGSKILVTTRLRVVAENASRAIVNPGKGTSMDAQPYFLEGMREDRCLNFIMEKALHGAVPGNPFFVETIRDIASLCYGIPLVIQMVAGLLSFKDPETEWLSVLQDLRSNCAEEEISAVGTLLTCFNNLPPFQKLCISYCSLFPRGHVFDIKSLAQLWEAQGYIDQSGDDCLSADMQGLQCFKMLWWRSFFHHVQMDKFGNLAACRMHDLMYDLACAVTQNEIQNLAPEENKCISEQVRHLSLAPESEALSQFPANVVRARSLRTLLMAGKESSSSSTTGRRIWSVLKSIFSSFKYLRALDAHSSGIEQLPSSIRNLTSLRYLDISGNDAIKQLPDSITELWNLQVLKLSGCTRLKQLPSNIRKLVNLKHLYCEGCWNLTHMPLGIGELTSLLTLTCFVLPKNSSTSKHMAAGLHELGSLKNLMGRLEIRNLGAHNGGGTEFEGWASFLREKPCLQSLSLCWDMDDGASADVKQQHERTLECCEPPPGLKELELSEYGGEKFPSWISSLKDLIRIKILDCPRCPSLPPLEEFPLLQSCAIDGLPQLEYVGSWSERKHDSHLFPSLKELYLSNCPRLKGWWVADADVTFPSFHCLSRLEIRDCPKLDRMPLFPTLDEKLLLEYSSLAPLQQTVQHQEEVSSSFSSLSRLKSLWILSIEKLQVLPEQWLQKLSSLQELLIEFCPELAFLPPGMRQLTSLRVLDVYRCPQLTQRCGSNKAVDWPNIAHIPNVRIDKKLIQLGGRYQLSEKESIAAIANFSFVHPLSKITSVTLESLESLPAEWVQNLSTLKELKIVNSPSIESWPQELRSVTLLERLQINGCPTLEKMCVDNDKDCSAIAHVPFVQAGKEVIRPKPC